MFKDVQGGQYKQSINEVAYRVFVKGTGDNFNSHGPAFANDIINILKKLNISTDNLESPDCNKPILRRNNDEKG